MEFRNASFFEHVFLCKSNDEASSLKRTHVEDEPRRNKRARAETSFGTDFLTYLLEGEPRTFKEAVSSSERLLWKEAIKSEINSALQNHTWELVDLPLGCKLLGSKWILREK